MRCHVLGSRRRDERGVATLHGISLIGLLTVFALVCTCAAAMFATNRRSQSAADLAALAGAGAIGNGADPCAAAHRIAARNDAALTDCRVDGWEVAVAVQIRTPRLFGARYPMRARARAGPVDGSGAGLAPSVGQ